MQLQSAGRLRALSRRAPQHLPLRHRHLPPMADADKTSGSRAVKPMELVGAGALALSLGALLGFSSHYFGAHQRQQEAQEPGPASYSAAADRAHPPARPARPPSKPPLPFSLLAAAGTAKELVEDGIDPRARLRLLPVAVGFARVVGCFCAAACWAGRLPPTLHLAGPEYPPFPPLPCRPRPWPPAA